MNDDEYANSIIRLQRKDCTPLVGPAIYLSRLTNSVREVLRRTSTDLTNKVYSGKSAIRFLGLCAANITLVALAKKGIEYFAN